MAGLKLIGDWISKITGRRKAVTQNVSSTTPSTGCLGRNSLATGYGTAWAASSGTAVNNYTKLFPESERSRDENEALDRAFKALTDAFGAPGGVVNIIYKSGVRFTCSEK